MDIEILKRKVSTFKTPGGQLRDLSNDLLMEILNAWEIWEGSNNSFYTALGSNRYKMASLLGKAKKLKREGYMASEFEEVKVEMPLSAPPCGDYAVELVWENGKVIRFGGVDLVIDFLKKAA